jgi:NADH-ubiquinone oxidoreductase chain 6
MGGLIVLFIYISSLASNERFSVELKGNYLLTGLGISAIAVLVNNLINAQSIKILQVTATNTIFKIYSPNIASLTFLTIIFLLLALVVIVSITSIKEGPLRSIRA